MIITTAVSASHDGRYKYTRTVPAASAAMIPWTVAAVATETGWRLYETASVVSHDATGYKYNMLCNIKYHNRTKHWRRRQRKRRTPFNNMN